MMRRHSVPELSREQCEAVAQDLLLAYESEDGEALQRLGRHYSRGVTRDELRARVWQRLESVRHTRRFTLDDARQLIAREAGFGNWAAFTEASGRPAASESYAVDAAGATLRPRRELTDPEWDALLQVMQERGIEALDAAGQMSRRSARACLTARARHAAEPGRVEPARRRRLAPPRADAAAAGARPQQLPGRPDQRPGPRGAARAEGAAPHRALLAARHLGRGGRALAGCDALENVNLLGTPTGDGALRALAGKPALRKLRTGRLVTDAGLPLLHQFPSSRRGAEARSATRC
jgi:hypothetical protein